MQARSAAGPGAGRLASQRRRGRPWTESDLSLRASAQRARPWLRDLVQLLAARSGLTAPGRRQRDRLLVVTLHRVLPGELRCRYPLPGLCVTPEELDFLLGIAAAHFDCAPLAELHARFAAGGPFPRPPLALTFDDGPRDNFEHARPVLAHHGIRATFYVAVAHVASLEPLWHDRLGFALQAVAADARLRSQLAERLDGVAPEAEPRRFVVSAIRAAKRLAPLRRQALVDEIASAAGLAVPDWAGMMGWEELRALAADGHEIGSHSLHHPLLPQCSDEVVEQEVAESRVLLEKGLGAPVRSFCYPNGDYDARSLAAVRRAGYACAVTTAPGLNRRGDDSLCLRRCEVDGGRLRDRKGRLSPPRLAWRLCGLPTALGG
jgi:peptidoglycan/xylan/chitin deacetylase (PgdA/CDA1 family)